MDLRSACQCGSVTGTITTRSNQDVVHCDDCGRYQYCAPRSETGRAVRSLRTRATMKPSKRARIIVRDNGTCVLCHRADLPLEVGHLISVDEGRLQGLTDEQLDDDENLAAMCAPCNSGLSSETVPLRLLAAVLVVRLRRAEEKSA